MCYRNTGAYVSICTFDQKMHPTSGIIIICLEYIVGRERSARPCLYSMHGSKAYVLRENLNMLQISSQISFWLGILGGDCDQITKLRKILQLLKSYKILLIELL